MLGSRVSVVSRPRDPLTGARLTLRAATPRELDAKLATLDRLRRELRDNLTTPEEAKLTLVKITRLRSGQRTVADAAAAYAATLSGNGRRRVESWVRGVGAELAAVELVKLTSPRCSRWIEALRRRPSRPCFAGRSGKEISAATLAGAWSTLRAIVRHASELGQVPFCPWGSWRPKLARRGRDRLPREAARDVGELHRLLQACRQIDSARQGRQLPDLTAKVMTAALCGLRQRELAGLRWSDVNLHLSTVQIVRQGAGDDLPKGRRVDVMTFDPALGEALYGWRAVLQSRGLYDGSGPVFPSLEHSIPGQMVAPCADRTDCLPSPLLRRAAELAGLHAPERWTAHSLRDSFVTLEHAGTGDLAAVAARSRHASVGTLVRYLHARNRAALPAPGFTLPGPSGAGASDSAASSVAVRALASPELGDARTPPAAPADSAAPAPPPATSLTLIQGGKRGPSHPRRRRNLNKREPKS